MKGEIDVSCLGPKRWEFMCLGVSFRGLLKCYLKYSKCVSVYWLLYLTCRLYIYLGIDIDVEILSCLYLVFGPNGLNV